MNTRWLLLVAFLLVVITIISGKKSVKQGKKVKGKSDKTKKVSSDKVHNGGRKGPMAGGSQGLPMPLSIPFPIIPLQKAKKKNNKNNKKQQKNSKEAENHQTISKHEQIKTDDGDVAVRRLKRDLDDDGLTEEELHLRDQWIGDLSDSFDSLIPGAENVYLLSQSNDDASIVSVPSLNEPAANDRISKRDTREDEDLMSLNSEVEEAQTINKRDISNDDDDDDDLMQVNAENTERHMTSREISEAEDDEETELDIVDEDDGETDHIIGTRETLPADEPTETVEEAQRQLENAEQASAALTALELKVGIDPEHLVSETHKYVMGLEVEKAKYDADIRAHIEKAQEAEKRANIAIHDDSNITKKSDVSGEMAAAKRQLEEDKSKIEEVNTELKQLKDIELMATGLEVAKYLAKERARHNLQVAQERNRIGGTQQHAASAPAVSPQETPSPAKIAQQAAAAQKAQQAALAVVLPPNSPVYSVPVPSYTAHSLAPQAYAQQAPVMPAIDQHQEAYQRNEYSRPSYAVPMQQSLTRYLSNYIQSKSAQANQFATSAYNVPIPVAQYMSPQYPAAMTQSTMQNVPALSAYYQPGPTAEVHTSGDQRHNAAKPAYAFSQLQNRLPAPVRYTAGFASANKEKAHGVGAADHSHKVSNSNDADTDESHGDWGVLSFPGTTYSPPPSWLQQPKQKPYMRIPLRGPYNSHMYFARPQVPPYKESPSMWQHRASQPRVPYTQPAHYHPQVTEISGMAPPSAAVAPLSTLKPYQPIMVQPVSGATASQQFTQQSSITAPLAASYSAAAAPTPELMAPRLSMQPSSFIQNTHLQNNLSPESAKETDYRPGSVASSYTAPQPVVSSYAAPQNQQAQVGEVIKVSPQDEMVTMNLKPQPQPQPQPQPDLSGTLPGWMGAVDVAKYENDLTDRLREKSDNESDANHNDPNVKRGYEQLINAEHKLTDTDKAAAALTHIESSVGFDPGSIAKMVDFVKTAAEKDVKLSKETIDKDRETIKKIEDSGSISKKSEIDKKSNVNSLALEHAKSKLKTDEAVLLDAEDRLSKIKRMELIVTEVEVAKYYATQTASNEAEAAKRTLDVLKRHEVTRPQ